MKYAIISDIHEDVVNLRLALGKIEKYGCDEIICLGDISGFSAPHYDHYESRNASECLSIIRDNCKIIIAGNHDLHSVRITPSISPLFGYPHNWYLNDYKTKELLSEGKIWLYDQDELDAMYTNADKEFVKTLPEFVIKDNVLYTHYIYPNITGSAKEFYFDAAGFSLHQSFMHEKNCNISFSGHQHHNGLLRVNNGKVINKRFNKVIQLQYNDSVLVPPLVRSRNGNGFCIFDTKLLTVIAKRL